MPTIIHYHHEEPPAKIRAVEIPRPKVHPLVLIRLPSDVESVKHKIPRSVEPEKGKIRKRIPNPCHVLRAMNEKEQKTSLKSVWKVTG